MSVDRGEVHRALEIIDASHRRGWLPGSEEP
jgi:hypothetical protein